MNEEKEEKGFVFKDRRKISLEDSKPRAETGVEEAMSPKPEQEIRGESDKPSQQEESPRPSVGPLPEVSFSTFVFSLSSSALVHLGEIPEPSTQQMHQDLMLAKQIIDTLGMLEEKTRSNLDPDEERFLKTVLYDLRLRYVQKSQ
jgi:hypothetical protein